MSSFITNRIKKERDNYSLKQAQELYKSYFVNISIYEKWRSEVDSLLTSDGYSECIVK